jgi:hypothetical protein
MLMNQVLLSRMRDYLLGLFSFVSRSAVPFYSKVLDGARYSFMRLIAFLSVFSMYVCSQSLQLTEQAMLDYM